ncbi:unnamed protein product, partial [Coccothraustes coccothraustes]
GAVCAPRPAPGAPGGTARSNPAPRQVDTRFPAEQGHGRSSAAGAGRTLPAGHGPAPRQPPATDPQPRGSAGSRSWHGLGSRAPAPARRRGGDWPRSRLRRPERRVPPGPAEQPSAAGWPLGRRRPALRSPPPPSTGGAAARGVAAFLRPRRGGGGREFQRPRRSQTTL